MAMTPLPLPAIVRDAIETMFGIYGQVVVEAVYKREAGDPPAVTHTASVRMLVAPVSVTATDGTMVHPGDTKIWIRASELASVPGPRAGDYVIEAASGIRRDIVLAQEDSSCQLCVFHARRVFA